MPARLVDHGLVSASGPGTLLPGWGVSTISRIAPIFPVRDLDVAMDHYRRLGFAVRHYPPGGYGYAAFDGAEIHLGVVSDVDHRAGAAYLFVGDAGDADELARRWRAAGAQVHGPHDTEWGRHEGATVDPDGNVIRFGSPISNDDRVDDTRHSPA